MELSTVSTQSTSLEGKYLTFMLAEECYGLQILKVQEIIRMMPITRVPHTPAYIRGVINLRGKVIPVVDLHLKFGIDQIADTKNTCIVMVQIQKSEQHSVIMGIIIDAVREVTSIKADQIEDVPDFGVNIDISSILGIGKVGGDVKILLNIDKVLTDHEITALNKLAESHL